MQSIETELPREARGVPDAKLGDAPLPKKNGSRGMLPSTWQGRSLRIGYLAVDGAPVETTGTYLDYCGAGPIFLLGGARCVVAWDRLALLELVND